MYIWSSLMYTVHQWAHQVWNLQGTRMLEQCLCVFGIHALYLIPSDWSNMWWYYWRQKGASFRINASTLCQARLPISCWGISGVMSCILYAAEAYLDSLAESHWHIFTISILNEYICRSGVIAMLLSSMHITASSNVVQIVHGVVTFWRQMYKLSPYKCVYKLYIERASQSHILTIGACWGHSCVNDNVNSVNMLLSG